jgi:predicted GTPase
MNKPITASAVSRYMGKAFDRSQYNSLGPAHLQGNTSGFSVMQTQGSVIVTYVRDRMEKARQILDKDRADAMVHEELHRYAAHIAKHPAGWVVTAEGYDYIMVTKKIEQGEI